jgi:kynureninase
MPQPVPRYPTTFLPGESFAHLLDAGDPLAAYRDRFCIPMHDGQPVLYFCGNSLGLQPKSARALVEQELDAWAQLGVEGHFKNDNPWYSYHELFRESGARLVGAQPGEVVMMNSLTVNLHFMLTTFYRPKGARRRILIDEPSFPSDRYAVLSQIQMHGLDPSEALLTVGPREGEHLLREEDIEATLESHGTEIAVVLLNGVNFFTGQYFDLPRLTAAAQRHGCVVGLDLAHAAGNVPLRLHDWNVDFAVWCSYKYLNAGPGAVAGCFVHERHGQNLALPRLAGWWGNDPATRFRMQLELSFTPRAGADGWQLSNPPILALAPLRASLDLFDEVGMEALRAKSLALNAYLDFLLDQAGPGRFTPITPREPHRRGCQLSLRVHQHPRESLKKLAEKHVVADFREPDVIRVAPAPLYNSFYDVWQLTQTLAADQK